MKIVRAELSDAETVREISHETIKAVYPHYYPKGAVDFFLAHHNRENILRDIEAGEVWLISDGGNGVGTVTVNGNEINRLFVLPQYQGKGFGRALMEYAEKLIFGKYDCAELSASLPAKAIYMKNGYTSVSYHIIDCDNGDRLCYDYIKKPNLENQKIIIEKQ